MAGILYLTSLALNIIAAAMAVVTLIAVAADEAGMAVAFLISTSITVFFAGSLLFALRGRDRQLQQVEVMGLAVAIWTILPLFGGLPFYLSGEIPSLLLSLFESVSGLTTTGSSIVNSPDTMPGSLLVWRAFLQWFGGLATVLVVLLVFAPVQLGGIPEQPLALIESGARSARKRIISTTGRIVPLYGGLTFICFASLSAAGLPIIDSLSIALATISTGGFMPTGGGIGDYGSGLAEIVVGFAMLIGTTSFIWHRMITKSRWSLVMRHREAFWLIGLASLLGLFFAWSFFRGVDGPAGLGLFNALSTGFFTAVSLISTTGIEIREGSFSIVSLPLLIGICLIGGAGFSAAGGVKLFRAGAMFAQADRELRRLVYPHGVRPAHFGGQIYDMQLMKSVWTILVLYLAAGALVTAILGLAGIQFEAAVTAAIVNLVNAGPVYSALAVQNADWVNYSEFSGLAQTALIITMILGRMEIIGLLVIFNRTFWRS